MNPVIVSPPGDPVSVDAAARHLAEAAASMKASSRMLADSNQEVALVWEGHAQRIFSVLAETISTVVGGSSEVAAEYASALNRYGAVLAASQNEVRVCRRRLEDLARSTPAGMPPDQAAVRSVLIQANDATARAAEAARELSARARKLMGSGSGGSTGHRPGTEVIATFISHAHTAGLASPHPSAAAFNAHASRIQDQVNGIAASLLGLSRSAGSTSMSGLTVDPSAGAAPEFSINPTTVSTPMRVTVPSKPPPTMVVHHPGTVSHIPPEYLVPVGPLPGTSMPIVVDTSPRFRPDPTTSETPQGSKLELLIHDLYGNLGYSLRNFGPNPLKSGMPRSKSGLERMWEL